MEVVSMLTTLPPWKQRLARLFTNPYYFRFEADNRIACINLGY